MRRLLTFELFEHYSSNEKAVEELYNKCKQLNELVKKWAVSESKWKSNIKEVFDSSKMKRETLKWWLGAIEKGEKKFIYDKPVFKSLVSTLFMSDQSFYTVFVKTDLGPEDYPDIKDVTITVNLGHNGKHLVFGVVSAWKETRQMEQSLIGYLLSNFDTEFKLDGLDIEDYFHEKRGAIANKKFTS